MSDKYQKIILYYFTGTGNSLKAARWIREIAEEKNIPISIYPIDRDYRPNADEINEDTLVGFLYPTHGFNAVSTMLSFMTKFPKGTSKKKAGAFLLNTRAGSKIFRWHVGGLSGAALLLPMLILVFKGFRIRGCLPLDMPSNWISLHPGYPPSWINFIVPRCEAATKDFARKILAGGRSISKAFTSLPIDIPLFPIAVLYYLLGRFILAKMFLYSYECTGCGICERNCPVRAITMLNKRPSWAYKCESCMRCISNCPVKAIQTSHLLLGLSIAVANLPAAAHVFDLLNLPPNSWAISIFDSYVSLLFMLVAYRIIRRPLRIKFFNAIFKYTSLTAYWRGYLAPGITLKDYGKRQS